MSDSGGTLTLPSPTHPHHHHVDVQGGFRNLRRSLSRSPSKISLTRPVSRSSSNTSSSPSSPSGRRAQSHYIGPGHLVSTPLNLNLNPAQSLATPFRPSVKLSLRAAKSASRSPLAASTNTRALTRARTSPRTSPRSPSRRALTAAAAAGNSIPSLTPTAPYGQENLSFASARARKSTDKPSSRHSMHLDISGAFLLNSQPVPQPSPVKKRTDITMNLDQFADDSPKAKRRSHGPTNLKENFDIFDQFGKLPSPTEIDEDDLTSEFDWSNYTAANMDESLHAMTPAPMLRKNGSLRKSTTQQRQSSDRTSLSRRAGTTPSSTMTPMPQNSPEVSNPINMNRPRLSTESFMPPPPRDSPFVEEFLPHSSFNLVQPPTQRHPLSRTITTSSSSSSLDDDSPTHFPIHVDKPKPRMNFSKSLPLGAVRPKPDHSEGPAGSVSTPDYKYAKPFEGAFASTGLVSKMNRHPEDKLPTAAFGAAVPDTPCKRAPPGLPKKSSHGYATFPRPPLTGLTKKGDRFNRHHGSPTTPFGRSASDEPPRPVLFQGFNSRHSRKGSLLSLYGDDGRSPSKFADEMDMCDEGYMPPTPTKNQLLNQSWNSLNEISNESPTISRLLPLSQPSSNVRSSTHQDADLTCKLSPLTEPCNTSQGGVDSFNSEQSCQGSTTVSQGSASCVCPVMPSFSQSRTVRGSMPPPPPLDTMPEVVVSNSIAMDLTKNNPSETASPLQRLEYSKQVSPRTPQEGGLVPDAGLASVSKNLDGFLGFGNNGRGSAFPPATPTTRQHTFSQSLDKRVITPVHGVTSHESDAVLTRRFGKVEFIGRGEFSEVYKVTETMKPGAGTDNNFFHTPTHQSYTPASPPPTKIFAVKKLVLPIQGDKDRKIRLNEVCALKALVDCDHILQLVDNWEEHNKLYIQTEFCEEGNLKRFLDEVGAKGRLDDFRIWKIMLEMTQGLKHIHSVGFVHRDIKPSNVLIGFDGSLKIGDFGLATSLLDTTDASLDLDGDREYLAPEALRSEIDTPIDIFSLGLIMLEIAANVKLPENGATWTALRENDFNEIPTLSEVGNVVQRDAEGMPLDETERSVGALDVDGSTTKSTRRNYNIRSGIRQSGDIFGLNRMGSSRKTELQQPPLFMRDPEHSSSLDIVVRRMLAAVPALRYTVTDLLQLEALNWVDHRRRAGATVFEGNWGPGDEVIEPLSLDTEMTDV